MENRIAVRWNETLLLWLICVLILPSVPVAAQDRLRTMPGYEQYQKMVRELPDAIKPGTLQVVWKDGGKAFEYRKDGKAWRYDIATNQATEIAAVTEEAPQRGGRRAAGVERGRQFDTAISPDGARKAVYRNRNVYLTDANGANEVALTTDGSDKNRVKYGVASWVYGEDLFQNTAMWWSPDGTKLAFYRFDESQVPDYYLQLDQTKLQSKMDIEAYPKAGAPNPVVDLLVYDVTTKQTVKLDVRDGKPFDNSVVGHYVYHIQWSPDGSELLCNRSNRRQNVMEFTACNPATGQCRSVVREEWPASWTDNSPEMRFLQDGKRFIWNSYRTGWKNYYL